MPSTPATSDESAIRIRGLVKEYDLGNDQDRSLKSLILHRLRGRGRDILRVLDGIDLEVPKGQALGVCGANGAGKSTLLKLIAGITEPTSGEIRVQGRVASLLELGAGFHPEMTGEENVLLNGVILGIPEKDLRKKMLAIFQDAGLSRFAQTPIKHYSTGMVQRLGFSIAGHLDPDILILDEIFAVGDALFQNSAIDIFRRFKAQRKTILLVSHDLGVLENYCDRVVLVSGGKILMDGPPGLVTHQYAALAWQHRYQIGSETAPYGLTNRLGDQRMRVKRVRILDAGGTEIRAVRQFDPLQIELDIANEDSDLSYPYIAVKVQDRWGMGLCQSLLLARDCFDPAPASFLKTLQMDRVLLAPGNYSLEVILGTGRGLIHDSWSHAETFSVVPPEKSSLYDESPGGLFAHPAAWVNP